MITIYWNDLGGYELRIRRETAEGYQYTDTANASDAGYFEAYATAEELLHASQKRETLYV